MELVRDLQARAERRWNCTVEGKKLNEKVIKVIISYDAGQLTQRQYQLVTSTFSSVLKLYDFLTCPDSNLLVFYQDYEGPDRRTLFKPVIRFGMIVGWRWENTVLPTITVTIMRSGGQLKLVSGRHLLDFATHVRLLGTTDMCVEY